MRKQKRYFQWIDGEMKGDIVLLESIEEFEGETFYNFDDGESCNLRFISKMTNSTADLKNKFMVEIESPSNPWTLEKIQPKKYIDESMKGEDIDIPSLHDILQAHGDTTNIENSDIGTEKLVPPRKEQRLIELPSVSDFAVKSDPIIQKSIDNNRSVEINNQEETSTQQTIQKNILSEQKENKGYETVNSFDPVRILVDSCKKHETPVELSLNMNLPSKYIANIASSEFENGFDKFIDCIVEDIDTKLIVSELKKALKEAYSNSLMDEN